MPMYSTSAAQPTCIPGSKMTNEDTIVAIIGGRQSSAVRTVNNYLCSFR